MADFLIIDNNKWENVNNVNNKKISLMAKANELVYSFQKVSVKSKIQFYNLLSTMLNSWLTVMKWVSVLEKQQKEWTFKTILKRFHEKLADWKSLSECLEMFPSDFSEAEVWMIKSWEKTWKLVQSLQELAVQTERVNSITWKIKSALIYPAFIMLVVFVVVYVVMVVVVPRLLEIFWDKSTLPESTQVLIFVSEFLQNYWILLILFFVAVYIFLFFYKRTLTWAYMMDKFILKMPVFWDLIKKIILAKFARIFSNLIWSWVSVIESLKITAEAVWNAYYKERILLLSSDVSGWLKIWESLDWDAMFPDILVQMIQVWEETAKLEETVLKVSDYYEEEVDNVISNINKLLEPFILITLALVVWFIALSILEPIMNLADTVSAS